MFPLDELVTDLHQKSIECLLELLHRDAGGDPACLLGNVCAGHWCCWNELSALPSETAEGFCSSAPSLAAGTAGAGVRRD